MYLLVPLNQFFLLPMAKQTIPQYQLDTFRYVHRKGHVEDSFGFNNEKHLTLTTGFELYSTVGLLTPIGPLKSQFYRIGFTLQGEVTVDIGLDSYRHRPYTVNFTRPGQIFSVYDDGKDLFGLYLHFTEAFLEELLPPVMIEQLFPFFSPEGIPFLEFSQTEGDQVEALFFSMDQELKAHAPERERMLKLYLYQLLILSKRSYLRQQLGEGMPQQPPGSLVTRYKKLVTLHFLRHQSVEAYADLLAVTANHLNRIVKSATGRTASQYIDEMILLEAKAQLKHATTPIGQLAADLGFADQSYFGKFFKQHTGLTPLAFRNGDVSRQGTSGNKA